VRILILKALCLIALHGPSIGQSSPEANGAAGPPTWVLDVAPIIHRSCTSCHRPGQPAPFSLRTYREVFKKRRFILEVVEDGYMPPWQMTHGDFEGDRRLSKSDISILKQWVDAGALRGDQAKEPKLPTFATGWQLGQPDVIVRMPDALIVPSAGADIVRNFVVPIALEHMRYVSAIEIRPGNRAVHHAVLAVDRTRQSRQQDAADEGPGFGGMTLGAALPPDGHFLGWTPGKSVKPNPDGMAWRLYPGDDLVLQLHAVPVGKEERVQSEIGVWFTDKPTKKIYDTVMLFSEEIDIAPGDHEFVLRDHLVLPVPVSLHSVYPHAHYVCKRMSATATLPDGSRRKLFAIEDWDFDWQDEYRYRTPLRLPAGTRLDIAYTYDNSLANENNPTRPLRRVRFGQESSDEMGTCTFSFTLRGDSDRPKLVMAVTDRDLQKLPNAWNLLLKKGQLERTLGNLAVADQFVERACEISPGAPDVWCERGMLAEAMQDLDKAIESYRRAISLNADHALSHLQLGTLYGRRGDDANALRHFAFAVRSLPNSALAHNNYATANFASNRLDIAEVHYRRAVELDPSYFNAQFNLGRVLIGLGRTEAARKELLRAKVLRPDLQIVRELLDKLDNE
jgi:tetratricopeptide (TPR) repeat protein